MTQKSLVSFLELKLHFDNDHKVNNYLAYLENLYKHIKDVHGKFKIHIKDVHGKLGTILAGAKMP